VEAVHKDEVIWRKAKEEEEEEGEEDGEDEKPVDKMKMQRTRAKKSSSKKKDELRAPVEAAKDSARLEAGGMDLCYKVAVTVNSR
jgi:hypothetical protein